MLGTGHLRLNGTLDICHTEYLGFQRLQCYTTPLTERTIARLGSKNLCCCPTTSCSSFAWSRGKEVVYVSLPLEDSQLCGRATQGPSHSNTVLVCTVEFIDMTTNLACVDSTCGARVGRCSHVLCELMGAGLVQGDVTEEQHAL